MDNSKKYEYVMDTAEIRAFCRFAFWGQFTYRKSRWIALLIIIVAEIFLFPEAAVVVSAILLVTLIVMAAFYYQSTAKLLDGQVWTVIAEGDRLKVERGNGAEVPFRNIQMIRRTKRLLMLGYMLEAKRPAWFVMPLRVFENEQEVETFLAMIRNPQAQSQANFYGQTGLRMEEMNAQVQPEQRREEEAPQEYMRFSFFLDGERWVRLQRGAADLLNSGTFGRPVRTYQALIWGFVMTAALIAITYLMAGELRWMFVCYSLSLSVWFSLRLFYRDPEKRIRRQLTVPEIAAKKCGPWQVALTEKGVTVWMPLDMKSFFNWDSLSWLIETQEAFYLFHKDKRHFIAIAKESFVSWDQVDAFHRVCADRGLQKIAPKKARYVPGWLAWTILALVMGLSLVVLMVSIFLEVAGDVSSGQLPLETSLAGAAQAGYPDSVPLDEQVETLASLGLNVPEETVESVRSSMVEYEMYDFVEGSPYTWLLMEMGMPSYDEDWNLIGYSEQVFWFDFEGYDLSTDYINVLSGMLALAKGSALDRVSDIRENTEKVDWERGKGKLTVSYTWEGQQYQYNMEVDNDWIDPEALFVFDDLLEQEASPKRFYVTGDNGQGVIVFFCTEEWAVEFMEKTGLLLESGKE